ncbi:hypothetical protein H6S82_20795 [Planktothrix sp. FACHB-1355]|uniref:Uncharacterized protein n=1 Tax=Aerosakkonema funiforme FACHB-1375 TaxID=2949571 RepID=A0A926VDX3_9CYAN|nr:MULTISPECIES: hypothetical protein [Oscillatoriales]MBD2181770.1 hypothetical protein [Aerosakkonema funiforme FACHB-1375]MBD3561259.1 hypothetical protein [Planktothrix sp. FACHB-1355]
MAYSDFTLEKVQKAFGLTISDRVNLFANIPELESSNWLKETLDYNVPIALGSNTEKARSELIIAPILVELRKQLNSEIGLFSGIDFTVDPNRGLNGSCDFIISNSPQLLILRAPAIMLVEAKKENINAGLGQCVAEMVAAQIFNEREGEEVADIYGVVTTGEIWKFLKLTGELVQIDLVEYFLNNINKILGILASAVPKNSS